MNQKVIHSASGAIQLTPNFYLSELTVSETASRRGINNSPNPIITQNLIKLAQMLEQVRKALGNRSILISSGYRSPELNRAIGGARNSDHMTGEAADFTCPKFGTTRQVAQAIIDAKIPFGQLIDEFGSWVHISLPTRAKNGEVLTARTVDGRTVYTRGLT